MAPEQISGGEFDARLDIYAMGCMAYEMLVHHPPFPMENLADVLLAQLNTPAPPVLQVRPEAEPKSLAPVIMKCLEKDPADRYANMAELEAAICEAQIAAGIITEWDDLPLPDIDPERRASLVTRMPGANAGFTPPKRRWLWPAVAAVSAAAITGVVLLALGSPELPPEVVERIEVLSKTARDAASVGNYVQPEGEGEPAIVTITALEAMTGPGEAMADDRGKVLRREFSNQLVTFADKFWDQDATRVLAYEYYDWALIFDGENTHAAARSTRTAAERRDLAERAVAGKLSESEKSAMAVAQAMVNPDEAARKKRLAGLMASNNKMSLSKKMALEDTVRGAGVELPAAQERPEDRQPADKPPTVEPPTPEPDPEPVAEDTKAAKKGNPTAPKTKKGTDELADGELENSAVKRDPAKAAELAGQGTAALNAGRRSEAEGLFNQAISFDRKCAEALIGLSDIYFDRGSAQKASKYAESAVSVAPNNGSYRLKLGDAYYAALRYKDALTQYEKAQSLGDSKAGPRITKVKAKLGDAG
jgi:tetratricopeptide (TPR) repeat protein